MMFPSGKKITWPFGQVTFDEPPTFNG